MPAVLLDVRYDGAVVLVSYLIASLAGYAALDLAKRVRGADRHVARGWWGAGSVALGTGIWAMHFVGMLALKLPFDVGYDPLVTALSWMAAVAVSGIALGVAAGEQLTRTRLLAGAVAMGGGICAMHYTGMAALTLAPGVRWQAGWVVASVAIAVGASAAALRIFFWLRGLSGAAAQGWQVVAAMVVGAAIAGMHYTGMAAAGFPADAVCLSVDGLGGEGLGLMVAAAAVALLSLTLLGSVLDARLQSRTVRLAASLRTANAELKELAFRDGLTGLPNRLLFEDRMVQAVQRSRRSGASLAVLFVDLDGFKPINDSFGHGVGDRVLCEMAQRLVAQTRAVDTVARIGGDEFVLLIEGGLDEAGTAQVAQRIVEALSLPVQAGGHELQLSGSIGIAMYPQGGPPEKLLAHADSAMYAAKRAGRRTYAFFEPHMDAGVREQVDLQRELRHALEAGNELELHYQPKVGAASGVASGVEALVRWRHPRRGLLAPGLFIPVAERFGLINALGDWVIDEACRQVAAWRDQGLRLRVAINLSVHQLRQDSLVDHVRRALQRHALDPALVTFEITESVAMEDGEGTLQAFQRLHDIGVHLSIDDFGTGYSSLSYLRQLQASQLKIDRSFVQDLEGSADARAIVEAVVRLAHALGLDVVAEGVETDGQRAVLQALRCDELQGYLFAKPMAAEQVAGWLATRAAPPSPGIGLTRVEAVDTAG